MFLRRCFSSGYLRGARRGTDISFCVDGGQVDFEGSFLLWRFPLSIPLRLSLPLFLCL